MPKIELDMEDFDKKMNLALQGMALDIQEALKSKLTKVHGKDTGALQASIIGRVDDGGVVVDMLGYGKDLEYGTLPHYEDPENLKGWARRKLGNENLAYPVAKKIRKGKYLTSRHLSTIRSDVRAEIKEMGKKFGTYPYPFIRTTYHTEVGKIIKDNLKSAFK